MKNQKSVICVPRFSGSARQYRKEFEGRYADERSTHSSRFVWDPWHIEDQYSLLRAPAQFLFSEKTYVRLLNELLKFGKEKLGCHGLSPPWVSLYLDGAYQHLHTDSPHGPWAYVYSLTEWTKREFKGGETLLAEPTLLNYWENSRTDRGFEFPDFFRAIAPEFNQLLVFDPRIPHGVKRVEGVRDPRKGRLVVHGWFVESRPFLEGALNQYPKLSEWLEEEFQKLSDLFQAFPDAKGTCTVRIHFRPGGEVLKWEVLTNTLVGVKKSAPFQRLLDRGVREFRAPRARGNSVLTLPLVF
jgi:hypothetical protein